MINVPIGDYELSLACGREAHLWDHTVSRAKCARHFDEAENDADWLFVSVSDPEGVLLAVSQRFSPNAASGFLPGVLLVPESHRLFIGAGTRLLVYDLQKCALVCERSVDIGFQGWRQHGDVVVMMEECELGVFDVNGTLLWEHFADPPWDYHVKGDRLHLDEMGKKTKLNLRTGVAR